jgi:hypothetical protein
MKATRHTDPIDADVSSLTRVWQALFITQAAS